MRFLLVALLAAISYAQTASCTCTFSADNDVDEFYIDGYDVSGSITNWDQRANWGAAKSITFACDETTRIAVKAVDGNGNSDGCGGGGFVMYCTSTDTSSIWHGLKSGTDWKAWGGTCTDHGTGCNYNGEVNYFVNEPANWWANDFDDSSWGYADQGRTAYASSAVDNCGTECEICVENTAGWLFRSPTGVAPGPAEGDVCTALHWRFTALAGGTYGTGPNVDGHYCFGGYGSYGFAIYDSVGNRILPSAVECTECRSSYGDSALYGSFTNGQHWCVWSPNNDGRSVLTIDFGTDVSPTEYRFDCGGSSNCITSWQIEASSDGANWEVIETQTDRPPNNPQEYSVNSCYSVEEEDQGEGGDLLIMKLKAGSDVFDYESAYWTNDETLNPDETTAYATDDVDAKLDAFNNTPLSALKICYEFLENCYTYHLGQEYTSAAALFSSSYIFDHNLGAESDDITAEEAKHMFTDMIIPPGDEHYDTFWNGGHGHGCAMQRPGINTQCNDNNWARIGYCVNLPNQGCQPEDSNDADSPIGIGLKTQSYPTDSNAGFGNYLMDAGTDYVDSHQKQVWIFIPGAGEEVVVPTYDIVLMKLKAGEDTFSFDSSYWTDDQTLNPEETAASNDDDIDAKTEAFSTVPLSALKMCFRTLDNCYTYDLGQTYSSARELFSSGYIRDDNMGNSDDVTGEDAKHAFTDMFIPPGTTDYDTFWNGGHGHGCDMQLPGINTQCQDGNAARIGYCVNLPNQGCQSGDGDDTDSSVGFGLNVQSYPTRLNAAFGQLMINDMQETRLASDYFAQAWLFIPDAGSRTYEDCVGDSTFIDTASISDADSALVTDAVNGDSVQLTISYPGPMELSDISFVDSTYEMSVEDWEVTIQDGCYSENTATMTIPYADLTGQVDITVEDGKEKFSLMAVFRYVSVNSISNQAEYREADKMIWMSIDSPTSFVVGMDFALTEGSTLLFDAISHSASKLGDTDNYGIVVHFKTWIQTSFEFTGGYTINSIYFDTTVATLESSGTTRDYTREESNEDGKLQNWVLTLQVPNDCIVGAHTETVHLDMETATALTERIELNIHLSDEFRPECAKSIGEFGMTTEVMINDVDISSTEDVIEVFLFSVAHISVKFDSQYSPEMTTLSNIAVRQDDNEVCTDCLSLLEFECETCADGTTDTPGTEDWFRFTISFTPEHFSATPNGVETSMDLSFDFAYSRRRLAPFANSGSKTPSMRVPLRMTVRDYDCHTPNGVLADIQHVPCANGGQKTLVCSKNSWLEVSGCQITDTPQPDRTLLYASGLFCTSVFLLFAVYMTQLTQREKSYASLPTVEIVQK